MHIVMDRRTDARGHSGCLMPLAPNVWLENLTTGTPAAISTSWHAETKQRCRAWDTFHTSQELKYGLLRSNIAHNISLEKDTVQTLQCQACMTARQIGLMEKCQDDWREWSVKTLQGLVRLAEVRAAPRFVCGVAIAASWQMSWSPSLIDWWDERHAKAFLRILVFSSVFRFRDKAANE